MILSNRLLVIGETPVEAGTPSPERPEAVTVKEMKPKVGSVVEEP